LLNSNISSICPHNMLNFGPLMAETCWRVWGTQQISTGFASWLRYCTDVAQQTSTKHCKMLGRLLRWYTVYTFSGGSCPLTEFCRLQNSLCFQILRSILTALLHGTRGLSTGHQPNFVALSRGRHLYSAGRPSLWASAHILVYFCYGRPM